MWRFTGWLIGIRILRRYSKEKAKFENFREIFSIVSEILESAE